MLKMMIAAAAALAALVSPALSETPDAAAKKLLTDRFMGTWVSDGDAFGGSAKTEMKWTPALGGGFARLEYRIDMRPGTDAAAVFEGTAIYKPDGENAYRAFWADNGGNLFPVAASVEGDALVALWGEAGGEEGRTRYELTGAGEMQVTDWIKTEDGWRQFNQNTFTRAEP